MVVRCRSSGTAVVRQFRQQGAVAKMHDHIRDAEALVESKKQRLKKHLQKLTQLTSTECPGP